MKKFFIFILILLGVSGYVYRNYTVLDVVAYAKEKPDPKWSPRLLYYSGWMLVQKDRNEEAIAIIEYMLEKYPEGEYKRKALFVLGDAYAGTANFPKAKELYEAYVEGDPDGDDVPLARKKIELIKERQ